MKRNPMIVALGAVLMLPALAMARDKAAKMDKMDANNDGVVTSAEHAAGAQQMFTAMDANKDGYVTAAEMDAHWAAKGKTDQAAKMKMSSADKIKEIDTDGDGRISAAEHSAGSAKMFAKMDANGDGKLTAAEMQAGHDKTMKQASSGM
jgi:Ca2+-binding EF-hand superfamily protein